MTLDELMRIGIAVLAVGGGLTVGLVAVLVWKQLEMTKILHGAHDAPELKERVKELEASVAVLTAKVEQQALENMKSE